MMGGDEATQGSQTAFMDLPAVMAKSLEDAKDTLG